MGLKAVTGSNLTAPGPIGGTTPAAGTFTSVTISGGGKVAYVLAASSVPVGVASSGSIGNNGALSGHTAFPRTLSGGLYLYFPANSIAAGVAAGFYWTVMSSTTAGTIYNSTYTAGVPVTGTLTAFVTTGPGAYTGAITEQGTTITIPANTIGANGRIRVTSLFESNNTANAKSARIRLGGIGGTAHLSQSLLSQASAFDIREIAANNATNAQIGTTGAIPPFSITGVSPIVSSVDMTASTTIVLTAEHGTATDWMMVSRFAVDVLNP